MSDQGELRGRAAQDWADEHLEKVYVDVVRWTVEYRDPRDGSAWLLDYPDGHLEGGGPPRLRRILD
jgi:hypothetical protein